MKREKKICLKKSLFSWCHYWLVAFNNSWVITDFNSEIILPCIAKYRGAGCVNKLQNQSGSFSSEKETNRKNRKKPKGTKPNALCWCWWHRWWWRLFKCNVSLTNPTCLVHLTLPMARLAIHFNLIQRVCPANISGWMDGMLFNWPCIGVFHGIYWYFNGMCKLSCF